MQCQENSNNSMLVLGSSCPGRCSFVVDRTEAESAQAEIR